MPWRSEMSPDSSFEIPDHVVARRIGEETIILDLESGTYFGLDPVGARAWELMAEGRTINSVCTVMLEEYDVDEARLERDLRKLVEDLRAHGLVR